MAESTCLKVDKTLGEKAIILVRKFSLLNRELRVKRVGDQLYIPLIDNPLPAHIEEFERQLSEFAVSVSSFDQHTKRPLKLVNQLQDRLPPNLLAVLPRAVDFIGDIAVVEIPPELEGRKQLIGEAILAMHKRVCTVLAKSGAVRGTYRLREFKVIAGLDKTETVHREHGCAYHLDLSKVYFSPRLSHEHNRVASQVGENETVVDLFAGVGPFSVQIAKKRRRVLVYAIDANPDAVRYLEKNIVANRVEKKIVAILGYARRIVDERLVGVADRVIMNLPERALEHVDVACKTIKTKGGIVHYYEFTDDPYPLETAKNRLIETVKQAGRNVKEVLLTRTVRVTAPYKWQVAVDVEIQ